MLHPPSMARGSLMRPILLGLLAAALVAETTDAQQEDANSANYILPGCQNFLNPGAGSAFKAGVCAGAVGGLNYLSHVLPPDISSCIPSAVTRMQLVRVIVAYIERRPQRMHEDFRTLALEAMHEAWPCR